jgi:hypothetical protein
MDPQTRVKSFIADYFLRSTRVTAKRPDDTLRVLKAWKREVARLDSAHFTGKGGLALASALEEPPSHNPRFEKIIAVTERGRRTFVETKSHRKTWVAEWFEYELRRVAGDWRIVRIREYNSDATVPFVSAPHVGRFKPPSKAARFGKLVAEDLGFDGDLAFKVGRKVSKPDDGKSSIKVKRLGMLNCSTGKLVVGDLGYRADTLSLLRHQVPPGRYEVSVALVFRRNAALRLKVSDRRVASWHPAETVAGSSSFGVDAGNIAILDVSAMLGLTARDKERAFERYTDGYRKSNMRMLSLSQDDDTAIAAPGWGDGRYPAYWGVDAKGRPAVLMVDFMVVPDLRKLQVK